MSNIVFSCAYDTQTAGKIEKDADGWYKINLGAVNAFNQSGAFYLADGVKELISSNYSRLYQKLKAGYLEGEMDHPVRLPGESKLDFFVRNIGINRDRVSHAIKQIELVDSGIPAGKGFTGNTLWFVGWVKPMGPKGELLRQRLEDKDCNVAFSIRSLTEDTTVNGVLVKRIKSIITFDFVDEPGIKIANKFDTGTNISSESFGNLKEINLDFHTYSKEEIKDIAKIVEDSGFSNESVDLSGIVRDVHRAGSESRNLAIWNW